VRVFRNEAARAGLFQAQRRPAAPQQKIAAAAVSCADNAALRPHPLVKTDYWIFPIVTVVRSS